VLGEPHIPGNIEAAEQAHGGVDRHPAHVADAISDLALQEFNSRPWDIRENLHKKIADAALHGRGTYFS